MSDRAAELLAPFPERDRVIARRSDDVELLAFAGLSVHGLRRVLAAGEIDAERGSGGRYYVTLADVARWRARRASSRKETTP